MVVTQTSLPCISPLPSLPEASVRPGRQAGLRSGLLTNCFQGERGAGLASLSSEGPQGPARDAHRDCAGSARAQQLPPHPPPHGLPASAPLCWRLGVSRPRGQLPSRSPVLVLLAVQQVPLEKARKAAMVQQDSQDHPCKKPGVRPRGPAGSLPHRQLGCSHPDHPCDGGPARLYQGALAVSGSSSGADPPERGTAHQEPRVLPGHALGT